MILFKRKSYEGDRTFWQIGNTDYYLSEDKTKLYLFTPYTEEDRQEDVELYEADGSGSTWRIHEIDLSIILYEKGEIITQIKRHLGDINKELKKLNS